MYKNDNKKLFLKKFLKKKQSTPYSVDQYLKNAEQTLFAYFHPLVYSNTNQLIYLDLPDKMTEDELERLNFYVGEKFENFENFCKGKLDIKTMKPRESVNVDLQRISQFIEYVPSKSSGRLNNLTETLITFENFDKIDDSFTKKETINQNVCIKESPSMKKIKRGICIW